jgi:hypothetical protein
MSGTGSWLSFEWWVVSKNREVNGLEMRRLTERTRMEGRRMAERGRMTEESKWERRRTGNESRFRGWEGIWRGSGGLISWSGPGGEELR